MNVKIKIMISYLITNPGRMALVILALVIGLWGIGSIAVSFVVLQDDLTQNYQKTKPAHVTLTADGFNRLNLEEFKKRPEIESAEFRDLSVERIEIRPNQWVSLWLFGVEDFSKFNLAEFYHENGKQTPDLGTMLIERKGIEISNLNIGSVARVRAAGSKIHLVKISGLVFDPGRAPSTMDHLVYAYVDQRTYRKISGKQSEQQLIFRLRNIETKQEIHNLTKTILDDFQLKGIEVTETIIPKPNEHPHQFQLNSILALQGGIGLLSFLMGAVLVWQLIGAILARQVRQIGIFKAIGASRWQVFNIYLGMVVLLGAIASTIAIPLAVLTGYKFAYFVAEIINFKILTTSLPTALYLYLLAAGMLLPVFAALPLLFKSSAKAVVEALNDYGVRPEVTKKTARKFPFSNKMAMIIRNTMRRKVRLAVTVLTMALGVGIFSTGFNLKQALIVLLAEIDNSYRYDIQLSLNEPVSKREALTIFKNVNNIKHIETWSGGRGIIQTKNVSTTNKTTIIALPYNTDLMQWSMIEGRWLQHTDELEMVVNQKVLETFDNPVIGERYKVSFKGKLIDAVLVGVVKQFSLPTIYMNKNNFDRLVNPEQMVNNLMFVAKDNEFSKVFKLREDIEKAVELSHLNVSVVMSQAGLMKVLFDHLNIILSMITFLALLVLGVSALGMASAMGINVMERTREIGVLRAIGATPKMIYGLFVGEGLVISITSILLGLLLAWPMSVAVSSFFGGLILESPLAFAFSYSGFAITLAVTFCFGSLASRIPARKAIKMSTREALCYE